MTQLQEYMTPEQVEAYAYAASLSAANEKDRSAWSAAVLAEKSAEQKAIEQFTGEVKLNRNGRHLGGAHPAIADLGGYFDISACYSAE